MQQCYREAPVFAGHTQEEPPEFYFNGYNYTGIKTEQQPIEVSPSTSSPFYHENYVKSPHQSESPTLRALLSKQKKQQDCKYFGQEETTESSCDYNKIDLLLSPGSERSSETDRESEIAKPPVEQSATQFYPWMKAHHGKSL